MSQSQKQILLQILTDADRAKDKNERFCAVFDLDSTLFCVSHRTQAILRGLAKDPELVGRFPKECAQLATIKATATDWGIRTVLIRAQVRSTLDFFEMVRQRWSEQFFSSLHLHVDQPYPGAVDFVQELERRGAAIRYLTGRDVVRMGKGTAQSLAQWRFPLSKSDHLHMKPDARNEDAKFKSDVLRELKKEYEHLWFFENEPVIINALQRELPDLKIVFIDSIHSGRETEPSHLPRLLMNFVYTGG